MENQFVPYELAVKLKELGFNEPCFARFRRGIFQLNVLGKPHKYNSNEVVEGDISAPLWQQAFDWFRVNKEYDLCIMPISMVGITLYYEIELHNPKDVWDAPPKVKADTYEQARYACLEKLIELCK